MATMNNYVFLSGTTLFIRISKAAARRRWGVSGQTIALCPCNLRPGFPWAPHITCGASEQIARPFDAAISSFEHYNCTGSETGLYAAFYVVTEKKFHVAIPIQSTVSATAEK